MWCMGPDTQWLAHTNGWCATHSMPAQVEVRQAAGKKATITNIIQNILPSPIDIKTGPDPQIWKSHLKNTKPNWPIVEFPISVCRVMSFFLWLSWPWKKQNFPNLIDGRKKNILIANSYRSKWLDGMKQILFCQVHTVMFINNIDSLKCCISKEQLSHQLSLQLWRKISSQLIIESKKIANLSRWEINHCNKARKNCTKQHSYDYFFHLFKHLHKSTLVKRKKIASWNAI